MKTVNQNESLPTREEVSPQPQVRNSYERQEDMQRKRKMFGETAFGVDCTKLQEAGYYCHWLNDSPGRISEAHANGYEFVKQSEVELAPGLGAPSADAGDKVSRIVGHTDQGGPLLGYLMKIPQGWKDENDAFYGKRADAVDRAVRSGTSHPVESGYIPKDGIKIDYQTRSRS